MSAGALLVAAGCGDGGGTAPTAAEPPDALAAVVDGSGYAAFRLDLSCAVADRDACAAILDAAGAEDGPECGPLSPDPARITVTGVIEGEEVSSVLQRRTTCESARYDAVLAALGL